MQHPVEAIFKEMVDLVHLKAQDYADDANVFSNFENTAMLTGLNTSQVFHVMISIKTERLRQLMSGKTPNFESREDTLKDLANYSALWIAWEREESYRRVGKEMAGLNSIVATARAKGDGYSWRSPNPENHRGEVQMTHFQREDTYPSPGELAIGAADSYERDLTDLFNRGRLVDDEYDPDPYDPRYPERKW